MKTHFVKTLAEIDEDITKLRGDIQRLEQVRATLDELYGGEEAPAEPAPVKPKRKAKAKPVSVVVMPAPDPVKTNGHNGDEPEPNTEATPLSPAGISIGRTLANPFTTTDLGARLDGGVPRAYTWVTAWKRKSWIDAAGFGQYQRTASFGT